MNTEIASTVKLNYKEKTLISLIAGIPFLMFILLTVFYCGRFSDIIVTQEKLGVLGDFYGGLLNPLIAYVALVAVIITLINNKNTLQQAMLSARDSQIKHTQTITQANAIALLNAFGEATQRARSKAKNNAVIARRGILQNLENTSTHSLRSSISLLLMDWDGPARCLHLLSTVADISLNDSIYKVALATLDHEEREYALLCLASYAPHLAEKVARAEGMNISENIIEALPKIGNLQLQGGSPNEN